MPVKVIDALKVVDIAEQQGDGSVTAIDARKRMSSRAFTNVSSSRRIRSPVRSLAANSWRLQGFVK
jgi:hypothetical protein